MNLYKHELIDHFKNPRNYGKLQNPDFDSEVLNPSCGDQISFQALVDNNVIKEIAFQGNGCVISQATASLLSEFCKGQSLETIKNLSKDDILTLIGIDLGPTRLRCGLLSLEALHRGINFYSIKRVIKNAR